MQDRLVIALTIDELDRMIGHWREADVPHQRTGGEVAFDMDVRGAAVLLEIEDRANTHIRHNFLGRNLDPDTNGIAAIAFARHILCVISDQRGNRPAQTRAGDYGKRNGGAGNVMENHPQHEGTQ